VTPSPGTIRQISAEIGIMPSQKYVYKRTPSPHWLWPVRNFLLYLEETLSVNSDTTSSPYQTILNQLNQLPDTERQSLVGHFFANPVGKLRYSLIRPMKNFPALGTELSKVPTSVRLTMLHHALCGQAGDVTTFSLNFNKTFLQRAATRSRSGDSFTSIINKKIKKSLQEVFDTEHGRGNYTLPEFWFVLEHPYPDMKGIQKGLHRFHVHGEIITSNETLPVIHKAMVKASSKYSVQGNRAVKFSEPVFIPWTDWRYRTCLTDYPPTATRVTRHQYSTYWPETYCLEDLDHTEIAAKRLGVETGSLCKVSSAELTREATACLKLLKILIENLNMAETTE
jgi:hypothetical protein